MTASRKSLALESPACGQTHYTRRRSMYTTLIFQRLPGSAGTSCAAKKMECPWMWRGWSGKMLSLSATEEPLSASGDTVIRSASVIDAKGNLITCTCHQFLLSELFSAKRACLFTAPFFPAHPSCHAELKKHTKQYWFLNFSASKIWFYSLKLIMRFSDTVPHPLK